MTATQAGSRPGISSSGEGGACVNRLTAVASGVSPANGRSPVTISKSTTPRAYWSIAAVRAPPSICSGAM